MFVLFWSLSASINKILGLEKKKTSLLFRRKFDRLANVELLKKSFELPIAT